ncbi:SDR family oxidoreductase [Dechloromonas sp. ZY10]|uniref:SDR family oxidoreductase n=1 Tax=Dechloromonas aquae TaxID=2664436 RepID=UPI003528F6FD
MLRKAIVTGYSRGLGAAIAQELQQQGFETLGLARQSNAQSCTFRISLDLADSRALADWLASGELASFLADAEQAILINNAGTVQPIGPAGSHAATEVLHALALNVAAPLLLSDAFIAASRDCPDRRILHVSSGAGRHAYPGWNLYCAGKAALDRHAEAVALERLPGLRIASLAPGVIDTDMQGEIRACPEPRFPLRGRFVELKARGQLSSPENAALDTVAYLLGEHFGTPPLADLRELKQPNKKQQNQ